MGNHKTAPWTDRGWLGTFPIMLNTGAVLLLLAGLTNSALSVVPEAPPYYILDEPLLLHPDDKHLLESLLTEHHRAAGEQIMVAALNSSGDQDLEALAQQIFQSWRIGHRNRDSGALLLLLSKEREARIEVGYGLEELLPPALTQKILREELIPNLGSSPSVGIHRTVLRLLTELHSPLLVSPQLSEITIKLEEAPKQIDRKPEYTTPQQPLSAWFGLSVTVLVLLGTIAWWLNLANEAYFTADGWTPYRWRISSLREARGRLPESALGGVSGSW